jgi:hypothetical protein
MYGYVYRTTNKVNGNIYIGQHHGDFDPNYLGSGNLLLAAIRKYGRHRFFVEALYAADSQSELDRLEIQEIENHRQCKRDVLVYNIANGGLGHSGAFSKEHIEKLAISNKSERKRKLLSQKLKGRRFSKETIEKMSLAKRGKRATDSTKKKMSESQKTKNPFRTEESNKKRSSALKGRIITPEWRKKISDGHKRRKEKTT